LEEGHFLVDGTPAPAPLVDFGLYLFHNARELLDRKTGPYYYLPKLQAHREARWWNDVMTHAETALGLPVGTARATVLIETLPAAFEMDEILYELREHIVGLNCGRWDYIFSVIKTLKADRHHVLPDRAQVTMAAHCMRSYTTLLIKTCHRRGAFAMGGMAAQIPIKGDDARNNAALEKVRADKRREAGDGHDGTWVAHPGLVPVASGVQPVLAEEPAGRAREDVRVGGRPARGAGGHPHGGGAPHNIRVGIHYLRPGCRQRLRRCDLMEDAATAEICRSQCGGCTKVP
jgi:malate synthase